MIGKPDREHLADMLQFAEEAIELLGALDAAALVADRRTLRAVSYDVLVIGEAAGRVSREARTQLPEIPWDRIIGMRHRLAHGYDEIRLDVVVETVRKALPPLIAILRRGLESDKS
jgi:uncharacterized protein with HEPN domain